MVSFVSKFIYMASHRRLFCLIYLWPFGYDVFMAHRCHSASIPERCSFSSCSNFNDCSAPCRQMNRKAQHRLTANTLIVPLLYPWSQCLRHIVWTVLSCTAISSTTATKAQQSIYRSSVLKQDRIWHTNQDNQVFCKSSRAWFPLPAGNTVTVFSMKRAFPYSQLRPFPGSPCTYSSQRVSALYVSDTAAVVKS